MTEKVEKSILAGTLKDRNLAETYVLVQNLNPMVQRLLSNDPNFTEMRVLGFQLSDEDIQAIAFALTENKTLKALSLDHLQIGDEGAQKISQGLCYNQSLTYFSLRWNDIGEEGGIALADSLHYNKSLKHLVLSFNNLGSNAGHSFANALKKNTTLETLDLKWNQIEDEAGDLLLDAMSDNSGAFSTMMLGGNGSSLRNARKGQADAGRSSNRSKSIRFLGGLGGKKKEQDYISLEQLKKNLAAAAAEIETVAEDIDDDSRELQVGDLVEIKGDLGSVSRRGRVQFIGETKFSEGVWVGVEFDSPLGRNNGTVDGTKYFTCPPGHGSFFRPEKLVFIDP